MTYSLDFRHVASVVCWAHNFEIKPYVRRKVHKIDLLAQDVADYPDAYQYERAVRLGVSIRCVGYALKRLGVTYKKSLTSSQGVQPSEKQSRRMKPQAGLLCIWMKVGLPGCNTTCRGRMAIASAVSAAYQTGVQRGVPM